jgi:hypothetical protein
MWVNVIHGATASTRILSRLVTRAMFGSIKDTDAFPPNVRFYFAVVGER